MKANIEECKNEIHTMIDEIDNLPRMIRLYSFIRRAYLIHKKEGVVNG